MPAHFTLVPHDHGFFHLFVDLLLLLLPFLTLVSEYILFGPVHVRFRNKLDLLICSAGMLLSQAFLLFAVSSAMQTVLR